MAACVRGLVSARFQKGKDTDPLAQGLLPLVVCVCLSAPVQCTRLVSGRSHAAWDKDTALYVKQKSRMPKVVSMRARREMTLLQGFGQVQLCHEGKGEWREESHRRRREPISDAKGAKGGLAVFPS